MDWTISGRANGAMRPVIRTDNAIIGSLLNPWDGHLDAAQRDIKLIREDHFRSDISKLTTDTSMNVHVQGVEMSPLRRIIRPSLLVICLGGLELSLQR